MKEAPTLSPMFTPPEIARRLRVKPERVIAWIRAGKLPAINVAQPGSRRPRFRISRESLEEYERTLAVHSPKPQPTPARTKLAEVIRFF